MTICQQCGRAFHAVSESLRATAKTLCVWCAFRQPRLNTRSERGQQQPYTTFEERTRLKVARFQVAMGTRTDFPGEVSLPDRRVPGAAWAEARAILAEFFVEEAVPDENEVIGDE